MELALKAGTWLAFIIIMLFMICVTLVVLCFFLPYVGIKAFWQLVLAPLFVNKKQGSPEQKID